MVDVVTRTLWAFFAFSVLSGSPVSACTSSFMDMDVIAKRAERITNNNVKSMDLDRELRVVPDWNFTCNSTITSLLLGVDIITGETKYPEVQTWRKNGNQFTRIHSRMIILSPGNFSASGVFQYQLTTPLPVVAGDMIGVYQPVARSSVVRLYYKTSDPDAPDAYRVNNQGQSPTTFFASTLYMAQDYILLSAITDIPQCSSNFLTYEAFKQKVLEANINDVVRREGQLRIFPDISFTCSGNLTNWIVAGQIDGNLGAELQIWRRSNLGQNNYTLVGSSVLPVSIGGFVGVYNYSPNPPLEFQEGDILGVYQRNSSVRARVYYQETTGPANYQYSINVDPPLGIEVLTGPSLVTDQYDYPLVTVEIATSTVNVTPSGVSTTEGPVIISATTAALTETVTEASIHESTAAVSGSDQSTMIATPNLGESAIIILPIAAIVPFIIIVIALATSTCMILFICWKRNHKNSHTVQHPVTNNDINLEQNVCYATNLRENTTPTVQHPVDINLEQNVCYATNVRKNTTPTVQHPVTNNNIKLEQNVCYATNLQGHFQENETDAYVYVRTYKEIPEVQGVEPT